MVSKSLDLWARSVEMPTDWLLMLASAEAIHSSMLSAWTPLASLEPKGSPPWAQILEFQGQVLPQLSPC